MRDRRRSGVWLTVAGLILAFGVAPLAWDKELYVLAGLAGCAASRCWLLATVRTQARRCLSDIMDDLHDMPDDHAQLAVVQFFSWFACSRCGSTPRPR